MWGVVFSACVVFFPLYKTQYSLDLDAHVVSYKAQYSLDLDAHVVFYKTQYSLGLDAHVVGSSNR
jgi:stress response protein SCP2